MSGYTDCACFYCMEIAISDDMDNPDLCAECEDAGCVKGDAQADCLTLDDEWRFRFDDDESEDEV